MAARGLAPLAVLPLVVSKFDAPSIAAWYLFITITGLQLLADLGFGTVFGRMFAYGLGGVGSIHDLDGKSPVSREPNIQPNTDVLRDTFATMKVVYMRVTIGWLFALIFFGTPSLVKTAAQAQAAEDVWVAWAVIVIASSYRMYGAQYQNYLVGTDQIALLKRWDTIYAIGTVLANITALLIGWGIIGLAVTTGVLTIFNVLHNRLLAKRHRVNGELICNGGTYRREIFMVVWPAAWRSAIGIAMSAGLVQITGIAYAQFGAVDDVSAYLVALTLMRYINLFSQVPFYTKLPHLGRSWAQGELAGGVELAKRGMSQSYWSLVLAIVGVGVIAPRAFNLLESDVGFVSHWLWVLMGLASFFERYGALHIQFYSITNHIIWHVANGVSGLIYVVVAALLFGVVDVYAFPIGQIVGALSFYAWYSAKHSYRRFGMRFLDFERSTTLAPLLTYSIYVWFVC
jgi:hypothetical protein